MSGKHYHVWVMETRAEDGRVILENTRRPETHIHRTSANRVRTKLIQEGTKPLFVKVWECRGQDAARCGNGPE